jgi:hypothetical protein
MWQSMKMYYRGAVENNTEVSKIQEKLIKFFSENPEVDHYLDNKGMDRDRRHFWVGIVLGLMIGFGISMLIGLIAISYWHDMGWLNVPGMFR